MTDNNTIFTNNNDNKYLYENIFSDPLLSQINIDNKCLGISNDNNGHIHIAYLMYESDNNQRNICNSNIGRGSEIMQKGLFDIFNKLDITNKFKFVSSLDDLAYIPNSKIIGDDINNKDIKTILSLSGYKLLKDNITFYEKLGFLHNINVDNIINNSLLSSYNKDLIKNYIIYIFKGRANLSVNKDKLDEIAKLQDEEKEEAINKLLYINKNYTDDELIKQILGTYNINDVIKLYASKFFNYQKKFLYKYYTDCKKFINYIYKITNKQLLIEHFSNLLFTSEDLKKYNITNDISNNILNNRNIFISKYYEFVCVIEKIILYAILYTTYKDNTNYFNDKKTLYKKIIKNISDIRLTDYNSFINVFHYIFVNCKKGEYDILKKVIIPKFSNNNINIEDDILIKYIIDNKKSDPNFEYNEYNNTIQTGGLLFKKKGRTLNSLLKTKKFNSNKYNNKNKSKKISLPSFKKNNMNTDTDYEIIIGSNYSKDGKIINPFRTNEFKKSINNFEKQYYISKEDINNLDKLSNESKQKLLISSSSKIKSFNSNNLTKKEIELLSKF